jgi:hypothetical protein
MRFANSAKKLPLRGDEDMVFLLMTLSGAF